MLIKFVFWSLIEETWPLKHFMDTCFEDWLLNDIIYRTLIRKRINFLNVAWGKYVDKGSRVRLLHDVFRQILPDLFGNYNSILEGHEEVHEDELVHGMLRVDFVLYISHGHLAILSQVTLNVVEL